MALFPVQGISFPPCRGLKFWVLGSLGTNLGAMDGSGLRRALLGDCRMREAAFGEIEAHYPAHTVGNGYCDNVGRSEQSVTITDNFTISD